MRIEAVCVSVDYHDFLEQTLPINMDKFHRLVVVTTPQDKRTQQVCSRYGVECVQTEVFYKDGDKFNKAAGINYGLAHLKQDGWILHYDADCVMPSNFLKFLKMAELDPKNIYSIDRVNCVGRKKWDNYKMNGGPMFEWSWLVHPPIDMPLAGRIAHGSYGGYVPIGYFQLWNIQSGVTRYPERQGTAEHTDVLHGIRWNRNRRILLPELFCIHLETVKKDGSMGSNWSGRKTPYFTVNEEPYPLSGKFDPTGSDVNPETVDQYFSN